MILSPNSAVLTLLIKDKKLYEEYISYVNLNKEDKELGNIYKVLALLFKYERESYTLDELETFFYGQYPNMKASDIETYQNIFKNIRSFDISEDMLYDLLAQSKARAQATDIGMMAFDIAEGKKSPSDLVALIEAFQGMTQELPAEDVSEELYQSDFATLIAIHVNAHGLRWRLKTLNRILGSLRIGNFGFLFARPETGKTTFLASEVTHMAEQLTTEHPAIWFNNEEKKEAVWLRIMQGALGVTKDEFLKDPEGCDIRFKSILGGKLFLVDGSDITKEKVERICKAMNPGLMVFDQLDKISGVSKNDREDLRLGAIYIWARGLAKQYCPVIAVCQADGTGEGVKWLNMGHVSSAKTSKQAEADWILGIGKTHAEGEAYVRYLNVSKNKLTGDADSEEALRHGRKAVLIRPEFARYEDVE
jgi:replicative DNA helicase